MTRFLRAFLGALTGAFLVLLINPASRPLLFSAWTDVGGSHVLTSTPWIPTNPPELPQPNDATTAGLWMVAGASRMPLARVGRADLQKLLSVAMRFADQTPWNAYWHECAAVVFSAQGNKEGALRQWLLASNAPRWDDTQSARLLEVVRSMNRHDGVPASWHIFAAYPLRSLDMARLIKRFARIVVNEHGYDTQADLSLRYATLVNGRLMRDGARSLAVGTIGTDTVELASYPPGMDPSASKKALTLARFELVNALRQAGMPDQAFDADQTFRSNDGWVYLMGAADAGENYRLQATASLLVSCLPGGLLSVSLLAAMLWLLGAALVRFPGLQRIFRLPWAPIVGVVSAVAMYVWLRLAMVAVADAMAFAFVTFAPGQERSHPSEDLGPFFRFALVVVAATLTVLLLGIPASIGAAGVSLLPQIGVPTDWLDGSAALVGLAALDLGLLLLVSPAWALVRKVPTSWVLGIAVRDLGKGLSLGAAALSVLATLGSVYWDHRLYDTGRKILENEPVYYLSQ